MLRKLLLCTFLLFGAMMGMPMRPDRIEEALRAMNRIRTEQVVQRKESEP